MAYEISVLGRVDADIIGDLREVEGHGAAPVTVLRSSVSDADALRRVLDRLHDRGLELVAIRQVPDDDDPGGPAGA
jgi:hypothetical protein